MAILDIVSDAVCEQYSGGLGMTRYEFQSIMSNIRARVVCPRCCIRDTSCPNDSWQGENKFCSSFIEESSSV